MSCDILVCRIRLHLGGYPPWLLTLSCQDICCLNSVQDLQSYDLHKWLSSSPSLEDWHWCFKRVIISWFSQKAINRLVIKFPAYNGGILNRHRPRAARYWNSEFTCQQIRYSKSLWRNGYYFINGYDLFYNGKNSPELRQAYNPTLGGYIIQFEIISNMQVSCHCQHTPWHLGANAKTILLALLKTWLITS